MRTEASRRSRLDKGYTDLSSRQNAAQYKLDQPQLSRRDKLPVCARFVHVGVWQHDFEDGDKLPVCARFVNTIKHNECC